MTQLNWQAIAFGAIFPIVVGFPLAFLFWRRGQIIFGSIVGSVVMFGTAMTLILREYAFIDQIVQKCLEDGQPCFPQPGAFTRFFIYASIGLVQVLALFTISLFVESRYRRRDYAPEWR